MSGNTTAARILAAQERLCKELAAAIATARSAGASPDRIADLEDQELAARRRYQELAVDMPAGRQSLLGSRDGDGRRRWWRFW